MLASGRVLMGLYNGQKDIGQIVLQTVILMGNEGDDMDVAVFIRSSGKMKYIRLDYAVGVIPNPLLAQLKKG